MTGSHPLFNVHNISNLSLLLLHLFRYFFVGLRFCRAFKIASEVLEKSNFFLKCCWILKDVVFFTYVLTISGSPLYVIEVVAVGIENNLCCVVKEYTNRLVA